MRKLLSLWLLTSSLLHADGGITLGQIERDGLRVTIFAAPVPIRAGPLDLTFLVQEIPSNQPATDARIECSVQRLSPPSPNPVRLPTWCSTLSPGARLPATAQHSRNKLLVGVYLPLTEAGRWQLTMDVARAQTRFTASLPFDVSPPQPPLETWWPLIAVVPAAILLYLWRSILIRLKRRTTGSPPA